MTLSHMVFNIPLDWIYDQYCPLHAKATSFRFTFALVIFNLIILFLVLLIVNNHLKLLDIPQAINSFKVLLHFPYHSICEKCRFDTHNIIKLYFSFS